MDPKIESALCYVPFIGWIAAIIFLIIEKNPDVRFNAAQELVLAVASFILWFIPIVGWLAGLALFILTIVLAIKTYQGDKIVLPVAGDLAKKIVGAVSSK